MRELPKFASPSFTHNPSKSVITQERQYRLITPLFGGGVSPAEIDPITVIRATEIRGHLRFWWRACRGGQARFEGKISEMREEEGRIWGKAYKKGDNTTKNLKYEDTVQISVEVIQRGISVYPYTANGSPIAEVAPPYAAFPLRPPEEELKRRPFPPPKELRNEVTFKLTITFPEYNAEEIEVALWAWETFGGVGARTRRGFGALQLEEVNGQGNTEIPESSRPHHVKRWLASQLQLVEAGPFPPGVPHLNRNILPKVTLSSQNAKQAWEKLIRTLARFRQPPDKTKKWPETEAMRKIALGDKLGPYDKFPKAVFGLPIVFSLKNKRKITLQGNEAGKDRLASPLILRPLICGDGRFVGLALLLEVVEEKPHLSSDNLMLKKEDGKEYPHEVNLQLEKKEADTISSLRGRTQILKAFIDDLGE